MDNSKAGSGSEPEIIERSRAYWSQRAKEYSALHDASRHQELRDAFRKLLRGFMPRDKGPHGQRRTRALDVGCGSRSCFRIVHRTPSMIFLIIHK